MVPLDQGGETGDDAGGVALRGVPENVNLRAGAWAAPRAEIHIFAVERFFDPPLTLQRPGLPAQSHEPTR